MNMDVALEVTPRLVGLRGPFEKVPMGQQEADSVDFFQKTIAWPKFFRHNRGLRLAKGVGICPN